jgi:hypothetical protein
VRQLVHGGVPEHFLLDFLHARHAVETRFFHGVFVCPLSSIAVEIRLLLENILVPPGAAGAAVELDAWVDVEFLKGGGLLWSEIGEGPVVMWRWSEVISNWIVVLVFEYYTGGGHQQLEFELELVSGGCLRDW